MVGFCIGLFIGGTAGFLTAAVLTQASLDDDAMEWEIEDITLTNQELQEIAEELRKISGTRTYTWYEE